MGLMFIMENNFVYEVAKTLNFSSVFSTIQQIRELVETYESETNKKVKMMEIAINVPTISDDAVKYLKNTMGIIVRKSSDDKVRLEISCSPGNIDTYLLASLSAINIGTDYAKYDELKISGSKNTVAQLKKAAQENIMNMLYSTNCPVLKHICQQNFGNISAETMNLTSKTLMGFKATEVKKIFIEVYETIFNEPFPGNESKKFKLEYWQASENDFLKMIQYK